MINKVGPLEISTDVFHFVIDSQFFFQDVPGEEIIEEVLVLKFSEDEVLECQDKDGAILSACVIGEGIKHVIEVAIGQLAAFELLVEVSLDQLRKRQLNQSFKGVVYIFTLKALIISDKNVIIDLFNSSFQHIDWPLHGAAFLSQIEDIRVLIHDFLSFSLDLELSFLILSHYIILVFIRTKNFLGIGLAIFLDDGLGMRLRGKFQVVDS